MSQRASIACGFVLLLIGVVLLLATTGVIQFDFWGILVPSLMIALGGLTLWLVFTRRDEPKRIELHAPLGGATSAHIRVRFGAGRLTLSSGATGDDVASLEAFGSAQVSASTLGEERSVEFWGPIDFFVDVLSPWRWSGGAPPSWQLRLREATPLRLEFETGACQMDLDLTSLLVRDLRIATVAISTMVRMPSAAGETRARISAGAAEVKVRIPPGVAARIRVPTSLGEVKVDRARFPGGSGSFESPDYAQARNKVDLSVEIGVASADIS